jgi:hypothetical protein
MKEMVFPIVFPPYPGAMNLWSFSPNSRALCLNVFVVFWLSGSWEEDFKGPFQVETHEKLLPLLWYLDDVSLVILKSKTLETRS